MRITDVYVGYLKITRIIQIGSILVKHGFKEMISRLCAYFPLPKE